MVAYYNENDPYAAEWLRNLIAAGHIAAGDVDERSIKEVQPDDIKNYTQCHFFAGIGVWSHALRRAGCPDDQPVWTGSCPCQPFSAAGQKKGFDDERHLWPVWFNLIRECRPPIVIGEQVANALQWLDLVSSDMEGEGYAFGASDLCAAGFSSVHVRQRLYFVGLADADSARTPAGISEQESREEGNTKINDHNSDGGVQSRSRGDMARDALDCDWLEAGTGEWYPVERGAYPLADASPTRVGRLRAYGNALDAETAAQFCGAVMDVVG